MQNTVLYCFDGKLPDGETDIDMYVRDNPIFCFSCLIMAYEKFQKKNT